MCSKEHQDEWQTLDQEGCLGMVSKRRSFNMDRALAIEFLEWIDLHAPQITVEHVWAAFARLVIETDDIELLLAFVGVGTPAERSRFAIHALQRIARQGLTATPEGSAEEDELYRLMTEAERQEQPTEGTAGRRRRSRRSS